MKINPSIKLWEVRLRKESFPIGQEGDVLVIGKANRRIFMVENGQWVEIERSNDDDQESTETVG